MGRQRGPKQGELPFREKATRGGKREGAGRKKTGKAGIPHRSRPALASRYPVHVTQKVKGDVAKLRNKSLLRLLQEAFGKASAKGAFRVVEFSIQGNHFHYLVEANGAEELSRGMQGLAIRVAKAVNGYMHRAGSVFRDRFHMRILKSPTEVRQALLYVLNNARKHAAQRGVDMPFSWIDPFSSGPWFEGWRKKAASPPDPRPSAKPRTWLLREGWMKLGLLSTASVPSPM